MLEVLAVLLGVLVLLLLIYICVESAEELNPACTLIRAWNSLKEKLNLAGCIIAIIPIGIVSLPGVIVSSVCLALFYVGNWFWKGFTHVFRKRK